jgi:hypothetical protein
MGDINQLIFIKKYAEQLKGPYLEVGSKDYGSTQDLRELFVSRGKYVGIDAEDGPKVDMVLDITEDFNKIDAKLQGQRFGTIFCLSVLEHCANPFKMADNMTHLLQEKGRICISVPFSWKIHAYPGDYWRFTPEGVRCLFPKIEFDPAQVLAATSKKGEIHKVDDELGRISFSLSVHWKQGHFLRGIFAKLHKLFSRLGIGLFAGYRNVMVPTNILMLGRLKDT